MNEDNIKRISPSFLIELGKPSQVKPMSVEDVRTWWNTVLGLSEELLQPTNNEGSAEMSIQMKEHDIAMVPHLQAMKDYTADIELTEIQIKVVVVKTRPASSKQRKKKHNFIRAARTVVVRQRVFKNAYPISVGDNTVSSPDGTVTFDATFSYTDELGDWVRTQAYVRRNLIPLLVEAPKGEVK